VPLNIKVDRIVSNSPFIYSKKAGVWSVHKLYGSLFQIT